MHAVQDDAHALPGGDESGNADEPAKEGKDAPAATSRRESDDNVGNQTSNDTKDTKTTSEDDTRAIAIADSPADEVGVRLPAQGVFDGGNYFAESRWVGGVLEGVEKSLLLAG